MTLRTVVLLLLLVLWTAAPAAAQSSTATAGTWVPNGGVRALTYADDTVYLGGDFTHIGPNVGAAALLDPVTGTAAAGWPRIDGEVAATAPDGAGGWFVGGTFTVVGNVARTNLAHITATGTVDPAFDPVPSGRVLALARVGTTLYVGGAFLTIDGQDRKALAAVDTTSGEVTAWNPQVTGGGGRVTSLTAVGSLLYAGGSFAAVGGQARGNIAAVDRTTAMPTAWNPALDGEVRTLAADDTSLYVGGSFTQVGVAVRRHLLSFDLGSGALSTWTPNPQGSVSSVVVGGGTVYAAGSFAYVGSVAAGNLKDRSGIASWTIGTDTATDWAPAPDNGVLDIALNDSTLYLSGEFKHVGGVERIRLAAVDATSGTLRAWDPRSGGGAKTLEVADGTVFAGGNVTSIGGVERRYAAAVDAGTGIPRSWNPSPSGSVSAMAYGNGLVYVGGNFSQVGAASRDHIAALDPVTGAATSWNPDANSVVDTIVPTPSRIYLAGNFTFVGGALRSRLAAVDPTFGGTVGVDAGANGPVTDVEVRGNAVYVVGSFTSIGGRSRAGFAQMDETASIAVESAPPAFDRPPRTLVRSGSRLVVIGDFDAVGLSSRGNGAALDLDAGAALLPFDPFAAAPLWSAATDGDTVFLGADGSGQTTFGGVPRAGAAALRLPAGELGSWNPGLDGRVDTFVVAGDALFVGGQFGVVAGGAQRHLGRFPFPAPGAVTGAATAITTTGATALGSVDPQGRITGARVVLGTTTAYGTATPVIPVGTGEGAIAIEVPVGGLAAGTTYHYRVEAIRDGETVKAAGADRTFTTATPEPTPTPEPSATPAPTATPAPAPPSETAAPAPPHPFPGPAPAPAILQVGVVPSRLTLSPSGRGTVTTTVGRGVSGTFRVTARIPVRRGASRRRTETISGGRFAADAAGRARFAIVLTAAVRRRLGRATRLTATMSFTAGGRTQRRTVALRLRPR